VSNIGPAAGGRNVRPKAKGRLHQPVAGATIPSLLMPLAPGTRLGSYEVVAPIGAGGMGEVYRARDTRLGRDVALKILPLPFASDPDPSAGSGSSRAALRDERLARFEREAKALAALNHPRIAAIYGVEEFAGQHVLVMELALGTSLADRLARGPLPVREASAIGRQIAEGIEAAHQRGILHRDLKPANIHVTDQGEVKILDFGLAKALDRGSKDPGFHQESTDSPTLTAQTRHGVILGTAAYMSPEQARGLPVDTRTDIWAFGCVLYECLTARRAFPGQTVPDTMAAVLEREPDWSALPAATPANVRVLLARCLRKDARERLRDIGDARLELADPASSGGTALAGMPAAASTRSTPWRAAFLWAVVGLTLGGAGAGVVFRNRLVPVAELPLRKFTVEFSGYQPIGYSDSPLGPVIAPNGQLVAYAERGRLWIRDLSQLAPREITGSEGATGPFWSPDSEYVGFAAKGLLKKAAVREGPGLTLCDLPPGNFLGGTWGGAGFVVVSLASPSRALFEVPDRGGEPKPLVQANPERGEADFHAPHYLPDWRTLLFTVHPTSGYQYRVAVWSGQATRLAIPESTGIVANAFYDASGYVLYERHHGGKAVYAMPFSLQSLSASGDAFLVADGAAKPSVSRDGTLLYELARPEEMVLLGRSGEVESVIAESYEQIRFPVFSPDGERVAFMGTQDGNLDIWVHDLGRGSTIRLTADPRTDSAPSWAPSGSDIAYVSTSGPSAAIVSTRSDGSGAVRTLVSADGGAQAPEWSPDGKVLFYLAPGQAGGTVLWYRPVGGNSAPTRFLEVPSGGQAPKISPDGRFVAYVSSESGRNEVYVRPFPEGQSKWPISVNGGILPRWNPRGRELFYVEGNALMAVPVDVRGGFHAGVPARLFDGDQAGVGLFSFSSGQSAYDVRPDGQHFVAVRRVGGTGTHLTIVQNWLSEFRARK
jgi:eukaryotic-like serine/threonine-protein kinase